MTSCDLQQIAGALYLNKRRLERRARREAWPYIEQAVRGGRKRLYPVASLPADVQAAIQLRGVTPIAPLPDPCTGNLHELTPVDFYAGEAQLAIQLRGVTQIGPIVARDSSLDAHPFPSPPPSRGRETPHTSTPAASCGQLLPAGSPPYPAASPAHAPGAGELAPGGVALSETGDWRLETRPPSSPNLKPQASSLQVGMLMGQHLGDDHDRARRAELARTRMAALTKLLSLPPRHTGRAALAAAIGRELHLSVKQVYRLEAKARRGGLEALIDKPRGDRGQARVLVSSSFERALTGWGLRAQIPLLAERLLNLVRGAWAGGAPGIKQCWLTATATLSHQLLEEGWPQERVKVLANLTAPRRFVEPEKTYRLVATAQRDAKAIYNQHHAAISRTRAGLLPGDLVFGDISPLDIPVLRPDGSTAYARMIVWHDAATNWLHVNLYLCPKGEGVRREHVAASFADLCANSPIGLPKRLYLDNGSEYKWDDMLACWSELARLTGQRTHIEVAALLPAAGRLTRSIPFRPRGKLIEGQFGNFRYWLAWHPAWQGGNRMAKKSESMGRLPSAQPYAEISAFLAGVLADYHATPQGKGTQLDGKSPQQAIEEAMQGGSGLGTRDSEDEPRTRTTNHEPWQPLRVDEEVLLLAFAEQADRQVRGGHVQYAGREWFADFLMGMTGRVIVRYPRLFGRSHEALFVFTPQGRFCGVATPEPLYGVLDGAGAKEAGRRGKALRLIKNELAGQVAVIDPTATAGLRGRLMGVDATVEAARSAATPITLSDEAKQLLEARNQLTERTQKALEYAAQAAQHAKRWTDDIPDDPDVIAARAWLGEEEVG